MKFSFMTFSTPELGLSELLATAERLGYDAVEPRLDQKHAHGLEVSLSGEERKARRKLIGASKTALSCLATSCRFAHPDTTEAEIASALERIRLAGDLGVPTLRVFGGDFPKTMERPAATQRVVESLKRISDGAAAAKVTVCLETHDAWCDPRDVAAVLSAVDHPFIAANWDILHPVRTEKADIETSFKLLKPWIRHVHVHDWAKNAFAAIGTGIVDHGKALALLAGAGYQGAVSGEWINWEPWAVHLPRELAAMKRLLGAP